MENLLVIEQSTRTIGQIIDNLDRLKEDFLELNIEEVISERPDMAAVTLLNLTSIKQYLETNPIFFLAACHNILKESDS